jgi:DNA modification methylase
MQPTVKPVALVADAMRDCRSRGNLTLDPFLGSGTTVIAAEKVGRGATASNTRRPITIVPFGVGRT